MLFTGREKSLDLQHTDLLTFVKTQLLMDVYLQSDEALWHAMKQGNTIAFEGLYHRYWSSVFTTAFSYLKDRETCMEITHDIFLNIWLRRSTLEIASFGAYLQAAARYHVYKAIKVRAAKKSPYRILNIFSSGSNANIGEENIRYRELAREVEVHMSKLPKRCQEIFNLSRNEMLSNDEIARQLGISKRTVENQLTLALQHLRMLHVS